ncbi:hypothetical protein GCM10010160_24820 [Acrocarpospora corrugata]
MRVLVAEDEKALADLVADGLRRYAMAVDIAYDGTTATERLSVNDYDVLVLDRDLPGRPGDAICRDLAQAGARTRILMLTAAASFAIGSPGSASVPTTTCPSHSTTRNSWHVSRPSDAAARRPSRHC